MKANELKVGGHYTAKVSGALTTVRLDATREVRGRHKGYDYAGKPKPRGTAIEYDCTNLKTGRKVTFHSAAKFRGEAKPGKDYAVDNKSVNDRREREVDVDRTEALANFDCLWKQMAKQSKVDGFGGSEYRRVRSEFIKVGPANIFDLKDYIYKRANMSLEQLQADAAAKGGAKPPFAPTAKTPAKTPMTHRAKQTAATAGEATPGASGKPTTPRLPATAKSAATESATSEDECPESPDGKHEFEADMEYDSTGQTINCMYCGEPEPEDEQPTTLAEQAEKLLDVKLYDCQKDIINKTFEDDKIDVKAGNLVGRSFTVEQKVRMASEAGIPFTSEQIEQMLEGEQRPDPTKPSTSASSAKPKATAQASSPTAAAAKPAATPALTQGGEQCVSNHLAVTDPVDVSLETPGSTKPDVATLSSPVCRGGKRLLTATPNASGSTGTNLTSPKESLEPNVSVPPAVVPVLSGGLAGKLANVRIKPPVKLKPTEEQQTILAVVKGLTGALVIEAGAGTGKTSTLKMLEETLPGNGQYTAFNSSLVAKSKSKFRRATCNTTHSLAFRAVGHKYSHRLGGNRVRGEQVAQMLGLESFVLTMESVASDGQVGTIAKVLPAGYLAAQVMGAIRRFCQSADLAPSVEHFRYIDGIDLPRPEGGRTYDNNKLVREYLLPYAVKAWDDLSRTDGQLPFSHDNYVKVWQLNRPVISADYILVDECFPAGTLVETDQGPVAIEVIAQNQNQWRVLSSIDGGKTVSYSDVTSAYCTPRNGPMVRITHEQGAVSCTANHPFWVEGKGWVAAGLVASGDALFCLRETYSGRSPDLLSGVWVKEGACPTFAGREGIFQREDESPPRQEESRRRAPGLVVGGVTLCNMRKPDQEETTLLFHEVRGSLAGEEQGPKDGSSQTCQDIQEDEGSTHRDTQPDGAPRGTGQGFCYPQGKGDYLYSAGRQRPGSYQTPVDAVQGVGTVAAAMALEPRVCRLQWTTKARVPNQLQDRHCVGQIPSSRGNRRPVARIQEQTDCGCQEGEGTAVSRVVGVEVYQPGDRDGSGDYCDEGCVCVYTLSVKAGSYFANGVLVKNCQDTAPVFLDVLKQQKALIILVGDSAQQIYTWRGAVNALAAFPEAPRRFLSQSFRFGQAIADVANSVLESLEESTPLRLKGLPSIPSKVEAVAQPRAILCRTNAAAMAAVLNAIAEGRRPHLIGGGAEMLSFVKACQDLQAGRSTSHPDLACFSSWNELLEYVKLDEGEDLKLLVKLIKEFGCEEILAALRDMPLEKDADLIVSTAHKSKGREWESVRLAADFPTNSKSGDEDRRLLYVAVTRAKLVLDISQCPFFTGEDALEIVRSIPRPIEESTLVPPTPSTAPAPSQYTWSKLDNEWTARGPKGMAVGTVIEVFRRDGSHQKKTITGIAKEFSDATLYHV